MATDTTGPAVNSSDFSARGIIMLAVGVIVLFAVTVGVILMAMEHSRRAEIAAPSAAAKCFPFLTREFFGNRNSAIEISCSRLVNARSWRYRFNLVGHCMLVHGPVLKGDSALRIHP